MSLWLQELCDESHIYWSSLFITANGNKNLFSTTWMRTRIMFLFRWCLVVPELCACQDTILQLKKLKPVCHFCSIFFCVCRSIRKTHCLLTSVGWLWMVGGSSSFECCIIMIKFFPSLSSTGNSRAEFLINKIIYTEILFPILCSWRGFFYIACM